MNPSRCLPPILALIERNELEESENLSEMPVDMRFLRSTISCGIFYLEFPQLIRKRSCRDPVFRGIAIIWIHLSMCLECCQGCLQQVVFLIYRIKNSTRKGVS
jgi:hypothetical protein